MSSSADVVATAVSRVDNLQFLSDVVPKTLLYKEAKLRGAQATRARSPKGKGKMAEDRVVKNRMRLSFGKATSRLGLNSREEPTGQQDSMVDDDETEDEATHQNGAYNPTHVEHHVAPNGATHALPALAEPHQVVETSVTVAHHPKPDTGEDTSMSF